jgi:hypothetical protein
VPTAAEPGFSILIFRPSINPDHLLHSSLKKVIRKFAEKFHPNDSIGFAYGLHHDTAHLHAHLEQPPERLGGVHGTLNTYLEFFLNPEISEVFCDERTFSISEIDRGKIVCLAMPQKFQSERLYINTILKLSNISML